MIHSCLNRLQLANNLQMVNLADPIGSFQMAPTWSIRSRAFARAGWIRPRRTPSAPPREEVPVSRELDELLARPPPSCPAWKAGSSEARARRTAGRLRTAARPRPASARRGQRRRHPRPARLVAGAPSRGRPALSGAALLGPADLAAHLPGHDRRAPAPSRPTWAGSTSRSSTASSAASASVATTAARLPAATHGRHRRPAAADLRRVLPRADPGLEPESRAAACMQADCVLSALLAARRRARRRQCLGPRDRGRLAGAAGHRRPQRLPISARACRSSPWTARSAAITSAGATATIAAPAPNWIPPSASRAWTPKAPWPPEPAAPRPQESHHDGHRQPGARAAGAQPAARARDEELFAREQETIFKQSAIYVGHEKGVPEPGDWRRLPHEAAACWCATLAASS